MKLDLQIDALIEAGIEAAKARSQKFGAKTVLTPKVQDRARELIGVGMSPEKATRIMRKEGRKVSKSTLYNHLDVLRTEGVRDLDVLNEREEAL